MNTLLSLAFLLGTVDGFYFPGVPPMYFQKGDTVALKVDSLKSVETLVPYDYYYLPFCKPDNRIQDAPQNLGENIAGERIHTSGYKLVMHEPTTCEVLCHKVYTKAQAQEFQTKIENGYYTNWILDNIPAAIAEIHDGDTSRQWMYYNRGYLIGKKVGEDYALYNHVKMTVYYDEASPGSRIVGFKMQPFSVRHEPTTRHTGGWNYGELKTCSKTNPITEFSWPDPPQLISGTPSGPDGTYEVIWSYDVHWEPSEVEWEHRWDIYLSMDDEAEIKVHWFPLINSLLVVVFLSGVIALILYRAACQKVDGYSLVAAHVELMELDGGEEGRIPLLTTPSPQALEGGEEEEKQEEGEPQQQQQQEEDEDRVCYRKEWWTLLHGDVFRPPSHPMLFCVLVGSGVQLACMGLLTILFAACGVLSPSNRGGLIVGLLMSFALMGVVGGYFSACLYRVFKGRKPDKCTLHTALLYPGVALAVFSCIRLVMWAQGSVAAVPLGSMAALLGIWIGVSVPSVLLGAYYGYSRAESVVLPVATRSVPNPIPGQPHVFKTVRSIVRGGLLPFGAIYVELYFIFSAIWVDEYYYQFGFLLVAFVLMLVTCAELTIVLTFFQLCRKDYRWWWRSFLTSGSTALSVFGYSVYYFFAYMNVKGLSAGGVMYFGYSGLIALTVFLCNGAVGFLTTFFFMRKLYAPIEVGESSGTPVSMIP